MSRTVPMMRRLLAASVAAVSLALVTSAAVAQDCSLSVHASPQVLAPGESAKINVLAKFASTFHAFAAATFDMKASHPAWTFASSGVIVGTTVGGIAVSQPHVPPLGILADPANPYLAWTGKLKPTSAAPALIEVVSNPGEFWVYPSAQTSSAAPRDATGDSDYIFVNPLAVGGVRAAPGTNTSVAVHDDVIVDGRIITAENPAPLLIGLLLPAVQSGRSGVGVWIPGRPSDFSVLTQTTDGVSRSNFRLTFNGQTTSGGAPSLYGVRASGQGSRVSAFDGFIGGVYVATGDVGAPTPGGLPALSLASIPDHIETRVEQRTASRRGGMLLSVQLMYNSPVVATLRGPNGQQRTLKMDRIVVSVPLDPGTASSSGNNLRQIALASHAFEAAGVPRMVLTIKE
ncbi:MAG: hypothetical protein JNM80_03470 [Phycisphaerae bacterium]|nr:hypothetical protein [Phycisphaerae bacterium]